MSIDCRQRVRDSILRAPEDGISWGAWSSWHTFVVQLEGGFCTTDDHPLAEEPGQYFPIVHTVLLTGFKKGCLFTPQSDWNPSKSRLNIGLMITSQDRKDSKTNTALSADCTTFQQKPEGVRHYEGSKHLFPKVNLARQRRKWNGYSPFLDILHLDLLNLMSRITLLHALLNTSTSKFISLGWIRCHGVRAIYPMYAEES